MTSYRITSSKFDDVAVYGIAVIHENVVLNEIANISADKSFVAHLCDLCNRHKLSPIHLADVVRDMLVK